MLSDKGLKPWEVIVLLISGTPLACVYYGSLLQFNLMLLTFQNSNIRVAIANNEAARIENITCVRHTLETIWSQMSPGFLWCLRWREQYESHRHNNQGFFWNFIALGDSYIKMNKLSLHSWSRAKNNENCTNEPKYRKWITSYFA